VKTVTHISMSISRLIVNCLLSRMGVLQSYLTPLCGVRPP